ncbi:MAG: IS1595 family transposase [Acidimicrobiales bacterium]
MAPSNRTNPQQSVSTHSYTIVEFMRDFPDDATCLRWLWNTRFNLGDDMAFCDRCGAERLFKRYVAKQQRQDWTCTACGLHVHPTAGTIYHKSSTPLHLWFYAMYLMTSTRCGVSAKQLQRELGVTYKTAWRMFTLIRNELMDQTIEPEILSGRVEMDETYWGGKPRASDRAGWKHPTRSNKAQAIKWASDKKTPVFGMVERNQRLYEEGKTKPTILRYGHAVALVGPKGKGLHGMITDSVAGQVKPGVTLYTDDSRLYDKATISGDHARHKIAHSRGKYVDDQIHTQQIEGFWSLLKRGLHGAHHSVSPKWMQGYVNEYVWRYNHRDNGRMMFAALLLRSAFPASGD